MGIDGAENGQTANKMGRDVGRQRAEIGYKKPAENRYGTGKQRTRR